MRPEDAAQKLAEIHWEGDSRDALAGFPEDIRADLGFALFELQQGKRPSISTRRMASIGAGVFELKEDDEANWYRVIYLSRIDDVIYVLHCFEKQSRKTDKRDLDIATERLSRVRKRIEEQRNMRSAVKNKTVHVSSGNVFADLGFSPERSLALKFKAKILTAILDEVKRKKYRQAKLVALLDEHQPVVSNLLRGKISQMSIEKLLIYADRLGLGLDVRRMGHAHRRTRAA